jgi:hypothetical protein
MYTNLTVHVKNPPCALVFDIARAGVHEFGICVRYSVHVAARTSKIQAVRAGAYELHIACAQARTGLMERTRWGAWVW